MENRKSIYFFRFYSMFLTFAVIFMTSNKFILIAYALLVSLLMAITNEKLIKIKNRKKKK